jgi:hypothetical protein
MQEAHSLEDSLLPNPQMVLSLARPKHSQQQALQEACLEITILILGAEDFLEQAWQIRAIQALSQQAGAAFLAILPLLPLRLEGTLPALAQILNLLKAYSELTQQTQEGAYSATKQPLSPPLQPLCLVAVQDLTLNPKMGGFSASRNLLLEDYSATLKLSLKLEDYLGNHNHKLEDSLEELVNQLKVGYLGKPSRPQAISSRQEHSLQVVGFLERKTLQQRVDSSELKLNHLGTIW